MPIAAMRLDARLPLAISLIYMLVNLSIGLTGSTMSTQAFLIGLGVYLAAISASCLLIRFRRRATSQPRQTQPC